MHALPSAARASKPSAHARCSADVCRSTIHGRHRPVLCRAAKTAAATDAVARLRLAGINVPKSAAKRNPELGITSITERVEPMLEFLAAQGLQPNDVEIMLMRCPRLFSYNVQRSCQPAVEFLATLGFTQQQVTKTIKRFPHILGYDTKGHLIPHCHYLKSLGLSDEELPQLILLRPHVLGSGIELVIHYLRKWLRIERTRIGRLLFSYPLDYSLPRLVLPSQVAVAESWEESSTAPDDADLTSSSSMSNATTGNSSAGHSPATAAPAGAGAGDAVEQQQPQQQQPRPPLGSAERCTWLDLRTDSGQEGDSSAGGGKDSGGAGGKSPLQ